MKHLFTQMKIDRNIDNYIITHINMLINISTAICMQIEWNTDKTLEKFVYAAYLKDMAMKLLYYKKKHFLRSTTK
ncbi:MAG: hypothetical protein H7281_08765 [Bacteriovorax sp.]|nr:hypothetical protein [Bacteriovorax sp.]